MVAEQVGRPGRSPSSVAFELGCDSHTVNKAVIAYGTPLVHQPGRIDTVTAIGLAEVSYCRVGRFRGKCAGRSQSWTRAAASCWPSWRAVTPPLRGSGWRNAHPGGPPSVAYGTLDLAGTYRSVYDTMPPHAVQVAAGSSRSAFPASTGSV